jgi:peptidoglycan/LPS O-acetylase OafA/YrhL
VWAGLVRTLSARGSTVFVTASVALVIVPVVVQREWNIQWLQGFPAARLGEFTLGVGLARLVALGAWRGPGLDVSLAMLLISYFLVPAWPGEYSYSCATIVGFALLIPAAAMADPSGRASFWRRPAMVRLGELSFSFYMVHLLVIRLVCCVAPGLVRIGDLSEFFVVAGIFAVSLALAWALYSYVETPCRRLLTRPIRRPQLVSAT